MYSKPTKYIPMKRTTFFLFLVALMMPIFGQAPNLFNYQAIAWNEGEVLADAELTVRFEILREGNMVWHEDHIVMTNAFGQFSTIIGKEDVFNPGGTVESFAAIDWGLGGYAIHIAIDNGNGFVPMGDPQVLASVPYALYAASGPGGGDVNLALEGTTLSVTDGNEIDLSVLQDGVEDADADPGNELITQFYLDGNTIILEDAGGLKTINLDPVATTSPWNEDGNTTTLGNTRSFLGIGTDNPTGKVTIQGDADIPDDIPLLEVRNPFGEVVMSTFNNGTFINIENSLNPRGKGIKGGFAIGGYNASKAPGIREFMRVTSDSIRVRFNEDVGKGIKGGFAIGGYNASKADPIQDYLMVTRDSTTVIFNELKSPEGGLLVKGYNPELDKEIEYFSVGKDLVQINGNIWLDGAIEYLSDMRFKTNVSEIDNVLDNLEGFRGVYYDWNDEALDKYNVNTDRQIGVLAQEVEAVYPELVTTGKDGYKSVDYSKLTAVLLEAIKEQQKQIEELQQENERLKTLEERVSRLEEEMK